MTAITLPTKDILTRHKTELYIEKTIAPKIIFGKLLPVVYNDSEEFETVMKHRSLVDDINEKVLSEPDLLGENITFGDIEMSTLQTSTGAFSGFGYQMKWTKKMKKKSTFLYDYLQALNQAVSGLAIFANKLVTLRLAEGAGLTFSDIETEYGTPLSDWASNPDPSSDYNILNEFYPYLTGDLFELKSLYMARNPYFQLHDYLDSFDPTMGRKLNSTDFEWKGIHNYNAKNSFDPLQNSRLKILKDINCIGFADGLPARIENAVDAEFSTIQAAREANPSKAIENGGNLPVPYVNCGEPKHLEIFEEGLAMWFNLGVNIREPNGIITGNIGTI